MKFPPKNKAEELLEQFCDGYNRRDLTFLLSLFTKNANMWGTGLDEYRTGLNQIEEQLKRDWNQSKSGSIRITSIIPVPYNANWAAAVCSAAIIIDGKENIFEHLRGTIIAEKENGIWKIAHMHASFPDYRNDEDSSFPNLT